MYTPRTPGFTAENSVERKSGEYGFVSHEVTHGQDVQPARIVVWCGQDGDKFGNICGALGGGAYSTREGCVGCSI